MDLSMQQWKDNDDATFGKSSVPNIKNLFACMTFFYAWS